MSDKDTIYRQDAIEAVCSACGYDCDEREFVYNAPRDEQVIMCPEHYALSTLPSAEPEHIVKDLVNDCVNRQGAIDAIANQSTMSPHDRVIAVDTLVTLPSAQPEIVRCKDCKWGREVCGNIECFVDSNFPPEYHGYEWFCPNGERRTG